MGETHRVRCRERVQSFHPRSRHATLPAFTNLELWDSHAFGVVCRLCPLGLGDEVTGHWLLNSICRPLPGGQRMRLKVPTL